MLRFSSLFRPLLAPHGRRLLWWGCAVALVAWGVRAAPALAAQAPQAGAWPWWVYPLALFGFTTVVGVLAVLAGIGGGVLFVPIVSGFVPLMHIDFIRGAGLMVAMTGALSAGPNLIRRGLTDLKLSIPLGLVASAASLAGAAVGLRLSATVVQLTLGLVIIVVALLIWRVRPKTQAGGKADPLAAALNIRGTFIDAASGEERQWEPRRLLPGIALFAVIGFLAGMFGLGAGWASTPVLNLVMGLPLKFSVATSYMLLAIAGPTAALVYLTRGAMVPAIIVPSVLGIMLGARLGSWLLVRIHPRWVRVIVVLVLLFAGVRSLLRGLGV